MSAPRPGDGGGEPPPPLVPRRSRVICGDAIEVASGLPAGIAQTCVTSPPYWGLRDYSVTPRTWGGDPGCRHRWDEVRPGGHGSSCRRCGAWRGGLGLEPDVDLYVSHLVEVMRDVRRVLRPDGTLWLNLGDSYAKRRDRDAKPKDLLGIPWRVALALRADGWWLRSDVIWAKANSTPEPVRDRPAHTHEYVFLLASSARYLYDAQAVREANQDAGRSAKGGRNRRSVWTLPTARFGGEHFAAFPESLAEPCVLAGSPPTTCLRCGAPWRRVVASRRLRDGHEIVGNWADPSSPRLRAGRAMRAGAGHSAVEVDRRTVGWEPTCAHQEPGGRPTVFDPFAGTGTTGIVAARHGRDFVGIELSGRYARIARRRIEDATGDPTEDVSGDATGDAPTSGQRAARPHGERPGEDHQAPKSLSARKFRA